MSQQTSSTIDGRTFARTQSWLILTRASFASLYTKKAIKWGDHASWQVWIGLLHNSLRPLYACSQIFYRLLSELLLHLYNTWHCFLFFCLLTFSHKMCSPKAWKFLPESLNWHPYLHFSLPLTQFLRIRQNISFFWKLTLHIFSPPPAQYQWSIISKVEGGNKLCFFCSRMKWANFFQEQVLPDAKIFQEVANVISPNFCMFKNMRKTCKSFPEMEKDDYITQQAISKMSLFVMKGLDLKIVLK